MMDVGDLGTWYWVLGIGMRKLQVEDPVFKRGCELRVVTPM